MEETVEQRLINEILEDQKREQERLFKGRAYDIMRVISRKTKQIADLQQDVKEHQTQLRELKLEKIEVDLGDDGSF